MRRSRNGFTLVELMVVIAIMGILAVIAVPFFFGAEQRLQGAARGLMGDINKAKSLAVKSNSPHSIVIASNGYEIQNSDGTPLKTVPLSGYASGVKFEKGSAVNLTIGGAVAEDLTDSTNPSGGVLTFNSRGFCNLNVTGFNYGFIYLKFKDVVYGVGVNMVGHVTIKRWNGSAWV